MTQAATAIPELVGVSDAITDVRRAVVRAAAAPFSVLIEGESGVGKELVARAVHQLSARRDRRFCDVNCAALPDELFESELFGHARGAFTGAVSDRAGLVEDADGGTLFLDEVADLSARAQAKLLRVVQQHEVRRVGETFSRKVDVRFVSAANRELRGEAEQGRFRQDLLYRLDVVRIRIPPLRERPEDVPPLARHFWTVAATRVNTQATLSHGVLAALARYHWPGNVRELQNVMAALAVEAPARGQVRAALLPAVITGSTSVTSARLSEARLQWERRFVEVALARAGGSRTRTARDLGLTRQGLLKVPWGHTCDCATVLGSTHDVNVRPAVDQVRVAERLPGVLSWTRRRRLACRGSVAPVRSRRFDARQVAGGVAVRTQRRTMTEQCPEEPVAWPSANASANRWSPGDGSRAARAADTAAAGAHARCLRPEEPSVSRDRYRERLGQEIG